jgi:hypothetical protein
MCVQWRKVLQNVLLDENIKFQDDVYSMLPLAKTYRQTCIQNLWKCIQDFNPTLKWRTEYLEKETLYCSLFCIIWNSIQYSSFLKSRNIFETNGWIWCLLWEVKRRKQLEMWSHDQIGPIRKNASIPGN